MPVPEQEGLAGAARGGSAGEGVRGTAQTCCLERKVATREASRRGDTTAANITIGGRAETMKEGLKVTHEFFTVPAALSMLERELVC